MNKGNRVFIAQLPAAVDHFLTAAFHFRVFTLHRSKVEVGVRLARGHRRRRTTTQTNLHRRATQYDQTGAHRDVALLYVFATDVAVTTGNHDWLVVTTNFTIVLQFESTEVTAQVRTAEFVVKGSAAQRAVDHDIEGRHNAVWLAVLAFPWLLEARNFQVGYGKTG